MADISAVAPEENPSPTHDELQQAGNGAAADNRGTKRNRMSAAGDDDDDDDDKPGRERRKIEIKFIQDKSRRHITFSKRKAGIMKKVPSRHLFLSLPCPVTPFPLVFAYLRNESSTDNYFFMIPGI
jgi:hypothetical protein